MIPLGGVVVAVIAATIPGRWAARTTWSRFFTRNEIRQARYVARRTRITAGVWGSQAPGPS